VPLMRAVAEAERAGAAVRFIGKAKTINVNRLPQALTRLQARYSYKVRVTGFDPAGKFVDEFVTISTDLDNLSPGRIELDAINFVTGRAGTFQLEDPTATISEGLREFTGVI